MVCGWSGKAVTDSDVNFRHASGTYDKQTGNGGSNGATMRFAPEANHGANAGLIHARERIEKVKQQFPAVTVRLLSHTSFTG